MKNIENYTKDFNLNPSLFMFMLMLFLTLISFILGGIAGIFGVFFPSLLEEKNLSILNSIISIIGFLGPVALYIVIKKVKIKDIIPLNPLNLKNIFLIIFIGFSIIPLITLVSTIGDLFSKDIIFEQLYEEEINLNLFQTIFITAIVPPIIEEVAFRGAILSGYKKNSLLIGVLMSSLYFGMMHGNLNQFFYATVLGIFMAFLVKITNSIYSSILLHFIFNFKSVIALYFIDKFGNMSFNELNEPTTILDVRNWVIFFLISLPFLLLSIFLFIKNNKDEINKLKDENIIIKKILIKIRSIK